MSSSDDDINGAKDDADDDSVSHQKDEELRVELSAKQKEVDQLVADVRRLQTALTKLKEAQVDEASDLAEKLEAAEAEAKEARKQLDARGDYDEIKKELG